MDPAVELPTEVFLGILTYLPVEDVCRARLVCKAWYTVANESAIWQGLAQGAHADYCRELEPTAISLSTLNSSSSLSIASSLGFVPAECFDLDEVDVSINELAPEIADSTSTHTTSTASKVGRLRRDRCRIFATDLRVARSSHWKSLYGALGSLNKPKHFRQLIVQGVAWSSFDHATQTIECTLTEDRGRFWSSVGSDDKHSSEYLVYRLMGPINVVTAVEVCAYKATYQYQDPAYTPEFVQFSVGFSPTEFHYQSPRFMFPEKDANPQTFLLAPDLAVGSYLRVDFHGHSQRQPSDNRWYIAISIVRAYGVLITDIDCTPLVASLLDYSLRRAPSFISTLKDYSDDLGLSLQAILSNQPLECTTPLEPATDTTPQASTLHDTALSSSLDTSESDTVHDTMQLEDDRPPQWNFKTFSYSQFQRFMRLHQRLVVTRPVRIKPVSAIRKIYRLFRDGDMTGATPVYLSDPTLRTEQVLQWLEQCGQDSPHEIVHFLLNVLNHWRRLNEPESILLTRYAIATGRLTILLVVVTSHLITPTVEIGDMIKKINPQLAVRCYALANCHDQVVRTLIEIKQYFVAISFLGTPLWQPECEALLRFCRAFHGEIEALHFALLLSTLQNGCLWPMIKLVFGIDPAQPDNISLILERLAEIATPEQISEIHRSHAALLAGEAQPPSTVAANTQFQVEEQDSGEDESEPPESWDDNATDADHHNNGAS